MEMDSAHCLLVCTRITCCLFAAFRLLDNGRSNHLCGSDAGACSVTELLTHASVTQTRGGSGCYGGDAERYWRQLPSRVPRTIRNTSLVSDSGFQARYHLTRNMLVPPPKSFTPPQ